MQKDSIQISSPALQALLESWQSEDIPEKKEQQAERLRDVLKAIERDCFFVRFLMKDFDSWYQVLAKDESNSSYAKKQDFYREPLIKLLDKNPKGIEPLIAIRTLIQELEADLDLADFHMTESLRFRYDTTIRMLADTLKKQGIMSKSDTVKNKLWALEKHIPTQKTEELF